MQRKPFGTESWNHARRGIQLAVYPPLLPNPPSCCYNKHAPSTVLFTCFSSESFDDSKESDGGRKALSSSRVVYGKVEKKCCINNR